jgi:hypothetical protein
MAMKKVMLIVLICSLLISLRLVGIISIRSVEAVPSVHEGDLILFGNNVTTIQGQFDINGSIIVTENATLILKDATVNFTQTGNYQRNITLDHPLNGKPRLQATNTTLTSDHAYSVNLRVGSATTITNCNFTGYDGGYCWLWADDAATFDEFAIYGFSLSGDSANASITNSSIDSLNLYSGTATVANSHVGSSNSYGNGDFSLEHSTLSTAYVDSGSKQHISDSTVSLAQLFGTGSLTLVNSTCTSFDIHAQSKALIYWYLSVHVIDSNLQDVPNANVTATYPNATLAESKTTDANGQTRLTLMNKMMNVTGNYITGNYTVEATYQIYSNSSSVNMTGNQQLALALGFVVPELPSFAIPLLFSTATLLAAVIRRKRSKNRQI